MHIYLLRDLDEFSETRVHALLPGLSVVTGQLDYILRSNESGQPRIATLIAESQHMRGYCFNSSACAAGVAVKELVKDVNRFIGKERVLCVVARGVWLEAVRELCGQGVAPADAPPLCLAHIHVTGMPAPVAGHLIETLNEQEILARATR